MTPKYRQGDVLLVEVAKIPGTASKGARDKGRIVLAYGEVTGHAHAIEDQAVEILEHEGTRYIRVPAGDAKLAHEEHGTIELEPGSYKVVVQKEYSPEAIRNVLD